jgi:hypothetical protein
MDKFKESRRENGIQKKHSNSQNRRDEKKTKSILGQICHKFITWNMQDETRSLQNFKTTK